MIKQLSPNELKILIDNGQKFRLIDVREKWEFDTAKIEQAELMPLSIFLDHFDKLDPQDNLVIMCHHGNRSFQVCAYLAKAGFKNVSNLDGGIDAWSQVVDPMVPVY